MTLVCITQIFSAYLTKTVSIKKTNRLTWFRHHLRNSMVYSLRGWRTIPLPRAAKWVKS